MKKVTEEFDAVARTIADMAISNRKGKFMVRGDGLMQFPVGKYIVSVGFGRFHYGYGSDDAVEVAVFDEKRNFVTKRFVPDAETDGVGTVTHDEFTDMLRLVAAA